MSQVRLVGVGFGSYLRLNLTVWLAAGVVVGLVMCLAGVLGARVDATVIGIHLTGRVAGATALLAAPLLFAAVSLPLACVTYLPFVGCIRLFGGLPLAVEIDRVGATHRV